MKNHFQRVIVKNNLRNLINNCRAVLNQSVSEDEHTRGVAEGTLEMSITFLRYIELDEEPTIKETDPDNNDATKE